ncbi:ABC transporter permease [Brenneria goodwinii]|uniref:ABC transporter permease n=1 Tax=Brenneria goodwinii TaxID=1109412 RepID=A0A0G4JZQ7_9GAMM|nr:ABC transporter permease [Brenneria goodwinii]ATA23488.1 ABC transporter permease [Brenneria goodwinii]RLM25197.1 ABC transporter permease [Brenneria goodwinii]CPR19238.1 Spermidine Putrescine ABC transporter permease component potC (TC_3.A.1.11.1) [Brenneria goodwinii]
MSNSLRGFTGGLLYVITAFMLVFILTPILLIVVISFSDGYFVSFPPTGFTLDWYGKVLGNSEFMEALLFSTLLAIGTTLLSLLLGVPAAFALVRGKLPYASLCKGLLLSPLIFPVLITGLALLQLFSSYGWGNVKLNLLLAHTVVTSPYVVRTVLTSLELVNPSLEEAARTLGASRFATFRHVVFPQIAPGVVSGAIFCFMVSFDNYPVSMWLADSANTPVPVVLYRQIGTVFDPSVATMSTLIILLATLVVVALERLVGLRRAMAA